MRLTAAILLALGAGGLCPGCTHASASGDAPTSATDQINFLSIVVDPDTGLADGRLKRFLERAVARGSSDRPAQQPLRFPQQTMPYGDVIRALAEREPGRAYLARITPYAYVAAEMLGADLNILATYKSVATQSTTYRSYFVVRKDRLAEFSDWKPDRRDATLDDINEYLKKKAPAIFTYHDRFSTSSYFLPSLYFKSHDLFAMSHALNPNLTPIQVERLQSTSSADLVNHVYSKKADLAAVWDGTKKKFTDDARREEISSAVLFVPIPTPVPNDFLVASGIDDATQALIVTAIKDNPSAGRPCMDFEDAGTLAADENRKPRPRCTDESRPRDDFDGWYVWDSNDSEVSDPAREALATLRQAARPRPTPVVVQVKGKAVSPVYLDAAKEAVRLSGTEFVLEDKDLHKRIDMIWTLESTHDGALRLTSTLASSFGVPAEEFSISFASRDDLPQRIADLVRSRMRRVRYIWPYEQKYPVVLRDLDFTPDAEVLIQRISWLDPKRNEYEEDTPFRARIDSADFSKLRLTDQIKFPKSDDGSFNFDPLSNVAYRVVIGRQPQAGVIWIVLPYFFIALFAFAGVGLFVDLRRQQPPPKGLQQTYERIVHDYHRRWRDRDIEEREIVWCDPKSVDETVKELKTAGSFLDLVQRGAFDFNLGPLPMKFSVLMALATRLFSRRAQLSSGLLGVEDVGHLAALETLIGFLVRRRRLSAFIGLPEANLHGSKPPAWPAEWEALNDIASRHFHQLGICDAGVDAHFGAGNKALTAVVSSHFQAVIKKALREPSLFRQTWNVQGSEATARLVYEGGLRTALLLTSERGATHASNVRVEVHLPPDAALPGSPSESTLHAWVFGKIADWTMEGGTLSLQVKPIALLKDYADQQ